MSKILCKWGQCETRTELWTYSKCALHVKAPIDLRLKLDFMFNSDFQRWLFQLESNDSGSPEIQAGSNTNEQSPLIQFNSACSKTQTQAERNIHLKKDSNLIPVPVHSSSN